jgi:hypothetical protein
MASDYYLELSENPVRFEAVNQLTNVFFDDSNKHVSASLARKCSLIVPSCRCSRYAPAASWGWW